ncbi:MAG: T9SS C-terminal target domain-containing protein [Ignavibacteriae bacterium]|nr:MAG: T9SS C-terminal target domain-containing protein [Ignavibacteriota bacterium]
MKTKILAAVLFVLIAALISNSAFSGPRRVLLEYSTGTWCGYCPCGDSIIEKLILPVHPQTIVLAYHGNSTDPFQYFNGNTIINQLGINAYPLALFDRAMGPPMDYDYNWPDTISARYTRVPNSVINLVLTDKNYNAATRVLTATVEATALQNLTGQYKINFVITEDNIVYQQNFYSSCGSPGYHPNFVHYWVVRNMINGSLGENVNSGAWNQNQTITKTITTTDSAGWVAANCNLNIFIYKDAAPLNTASIEQATKQSVTSPLGVSNTNEVPADYTLSQNYPNPFNPVTNIKFTIPENGKVSLKIYNISGKEVMTMVDGFLNAGSYNAEVDASNLSSGVYFYTLLTDKFSQTKKMVLIK